MKKIELSDENYTRLEKLSTHLGLSLEELLTGVAGLADARTTSDALKALVEAHTQGTSWYVLRQTSVAANVAE
jgi:hypothetical protein